MSSTPERVLWAIAQLALDPSDNVLEVGCGGGHAVTLLCAQLRRGGVIAFDRSALQVKRARERNAAWIASGRARIEQLTLEEAPAALGSGRFDRILAINVNTFWTAPEPSMIALAALLEPGGSAYLVYEPPSPARLREARRILPELLTRGGLVAADVRTTTFRRSHGLCIVGQRASEGARAT